MNTFSENGNDFVGRLLHEGGFRVGPFPHFPKPKRPVRAMRRVSFTGIQLETTDTSTRDPRCPVDSLLLSKTPRLTSPERSRLRQIETHR